MVAVKAVVVFALVVASVASAPALAGNPFGDACFPNETQFEQGSGRRSPVCETGVAFTNAGAWLCRHASGADSCDAADGRTIDSAKVDAYLLSDTHAQLTALREAEDSLPLGQTFWVSTHNTYHAAVYAPTLSGLDPNQQYSLRDQLRMDARAIEIDVHWMPMPSEGGHAPMVCHATADDQGDIGCTNERHLRAVLPELAQWLAANPDEVVLIYVQDELNRFAQNGLLAHGVAAAVFEAGIGPRIFRPADSGRTCADGLPLDVSRDAIRAAGKQVLLISDCGLGTAWPAIVHSIARPASGNYLEAQWRADLHGGCLWPAADYVGRWTRTWEDATWVTEMSDSGGMASARGDLLGPDALAIPVDCGMNMVSLDHLQPDDGRLALLAERWAAR